MKILLLSAYDALSHRYWREGLVEQFPAIDWTVLTLPARYFRYRVRSNPLTWMAEKQAVLQANYDVVVATSMVDIATLRGLIPSLATTPLWLYCHENQFAYPAGVQKDNAATHDLEAKMVFLYACLAADHISFNSNWNRDSALAGLKDLLHRFPEKLNASLLNSIATKSDVVPVPLKALTKPAEMPSQNIATKRVSALSSKPLRVLWNHRWEFDKGPDNLLALVNALQASGLSCELNIVGQQFRQTPEAFAAIEAVLNQSSTLQKGEWGYVESVSDYQRLLQQCDIVISTALHDFQGIAVLEAVQSGCVPLLPRKIVYPEIFADQYLYAVDETLSSSLPSTTANNICQLINQWQQQGLPSVPDVKQFEWHLQRELYQKRIQSLYKHL